MVLSSFFSDLIAGVPHARIQACTVVYAETTPRGEYHRLPVSKVKQGVPGVFGLGVSGADERMGLTTGESIKSRR